MENSLQERIIEFTADTLLDGELLSFLTDIPLEKLNPYIKVYGLLNLPKHIDIMNLEAGQKSKLSAIYTYIQRVNTSVYKQKNVLKNPADAAAYLMKLMQFVPNESFFCIFLDSEIRVISTKSFGNGSSNIVAVSKREILKQALLQNAHSVIIAHNHPSNSCTPSKEDLEFTKQLFMALGCVGIILEDHLIIAQNEYRNLALTNKEIFEAGE